MRRPAVKPSLSALLLLAALGGAAPGGDKVTVRWALEGSDLAIWDVFVLPESDVYAETDRPPNLRLGLYGYQIDDHGEARFPTHVVEEIPYDLALRVPVGKVKDDQRVRIGRRYDDIRGHWPIDVVISGEVVESSEKGIRFEGEIAGTPAPRYDGARPELRKWLTKLSGDLEIDFDLEKGVVTSSVVRIETSSEPRPEAWPKDPPEAKERPYRFRFSLQKIREYDLEWADKPWKLGTSVGHAIVMGVDWLRSEVRADGTYGAFGKYPHGETCLAALTLLVCEAKRDDPFIVDLMDRIRGFQPTNTYEIALALMAMEAYYAPANEVSEVHAGKRAVPQRRQVKPKDLEWMQKLTDRLISIGNRHSKGMGWGYNRENSRVDLSNTQYAALGLLSAWRCGVRIPEEVWVELGKGVMRHQTPEVKQNLVIVRVGERERKRGTRTRSAGGKAVTAWGYAYYPGAEEPKASMTCGGISTLQIVRDVLRVGGSKYLRSGLGRSLDEAIEHGWAWTARHWMIQRHAPDHGHGWMLYYLYSLERAGVLCGVRKVNGHDWYYEGAAWLLATQEESGQWKEKSADLHHTCFALLFLKLGTIPISLPEKTGAGR